ncbi:hypothetical protein VdG1_09286 [Verticillium dahliae VDG1]|nr:hypothetical protein VdG1_09286 [Verticillium dahliae VDG1]
MLQGILLAAPQAEFLRLLSPLAHRALELADKARDRPGVIETLPPLRSGKQLDRSRRHALVRALHRQEKERHHDTRLRR